MKNAIKNQVGMLNDMFLWPVANLKQGVIYFIKQALPPNISAESVGIRKSSTMVWILNQNAIWKFCFDILINRVLHNNDQVVLNKKLSNK